MSLKSVNTEPDWENGIQKSLYKGHEGKQEVILGPIILQPPDLIFQLNGENILATKVKQTVPPALGTDEMVRLAPANMGSDYDQNLPAHSPQTWMSPTRAVKQEPGTDDELLLVSDLGTDEMVRLGLTPESMGTDYDECHKNVVADIKKEASQSSQPYKEDENPKQMDACVGLPASHVGSLKDELFKNEASDCKAGVNRRSRRITNKQKVEETKKEFTKFSSRLTFETDSEDNDTDSEYEEKDSKIEETGSKDEESDSDNDENLNKNSCVKKRKLKVKKQKKRHICEFCNKEFAFRAGLTCHTRIHTGEKPYSCNICSKSFSDYAVLVRHRRMHSGDKPHVCDICGRKYSEKYLLKNHKLVHTGDMQYFCKFCPKQFVNSSNYRRHQKIHMHKFICDTCTKSFAKKDMLISHIINHSKPKPFTCKFCKKCFGQSGHLNRHLLIHTGIKEMFPCVNCGQEFTQKVSLKRHVQRNVCKKKIVKNQDI